MTRVSAVLLVLVLMTGAAGAVDPRYPDWPCNQIKVPELSLAAVWSGPPIDDVAQSWRSDAHVRDTVARLAARRTPVEEAEKIVADELHGEAHAREARAKLLMAGLFETLAQERSQVMDGIERFSRRQKAFADKIRNETRDIRALEDTPGHDTAKVEDLANTIAWDTRIFEDQRRTVGYVCEVPTAIERRLFALARAIQQALE
jgi:hypothetical protein